MKSTAAVTTIAIDLAKNVFQLALADASFRIVRSLRLKRADFLSFWPNHPVVHVVMEACGRPALPAPEGTSHIPVGLLGASLRTLVERDGPSGDAVAAAVR